MHVRLNRHIRDATGVVFGPGAVIEVSPSGARNLVRLGYGVIVGQDPEPNRDAEPAAAQGAEPEPESQPKPKRHRRKREA